MACLERDPSDRPKSTLEVGQLLNEDQNRDSQHSDAFENDSREEHEYIEHYDTILDACQYGCLEDVKWHIENGENVFAREDKTGNTLLHCAAFGGPIEQEKIEIAKFLLSEGLEIDARNKWNETPLHCAAWKGHAEFAKFLIFNGARINAEDHNGRTPLRSNIESPWVGTSVIETRKLLKEYGASE
jgi:ankyrin repeat protein